MALLSEYREARRNEEVARLRRVLALRSMIASGLSQRQIAAAVGISQPAVSQQLKVAHDLNDVHPELLVDAAGPVLRALAAEHGFSKLAVFGSVARRQARADSDIDLVVESPPNTSSFEFLRFKFLIEQVLGREIDLSDYKGIKPGIDDDIYREAILL